jgi:hypothetical protein
MATIAEIRQQYPQYADLSDDQLAQSLHQKHYSDIPYGEFRAKLGLQTGATAQWGRGATGTWESPELAAMSPLDRYRAGGRVAGQEVVMGARQLFGQDVPAEQVDAFRSKNAELMQDPTARAGSTTANVGMATLPALIPGAGSIVGGILSGGLYGAVQPVGTGDSRADNVIQGAATQGAVAGVMRGVGRVFQPIKNANNLEEQAAVDLLRRNGVQLSVGAQTGSKATRSTERVLRDNPYTAPAMEVQGAKSGRSLTRAFLRTAGVNADKATPEILGAADRRIGNTIGSINARYKMDISEPTIDARLVDIADEVSNLPNGNYVGSLIEKIRSSAQNGILDAKIAQKFRTILGKMSRDPVVGEYAYQTREVLDEALQNATKGTNDFEKLAQARIEYRNLSALADVADTTANGQISGPALASRLAHSQYTRNSFKYGTGDTRLTELARASSTVADRFPNSGTAARAGAQLIAPTLVGGASYLNDKDPERALKLAAMTYGLPKAAAFAMNNPATANYLARGIPMPDAANQLGSYLARLTPPAATALVLNQ